MVLFMYFRIFVVLLFIDEIHLQSNLFKRDLFKRDSGLSGTFVFAFSILSSYKSRWLRGILL
jgi:hypothetical protein